MESQDQNVVNLCDYLKMIIWQWQQSAAVERGSAIKCTRVGGGVCGRRARCWHSDARQCNVFDTHSFMRQ
jgi:hypothetical protein